MSNIADITADGKQEIINVLGKKYTPKIIAHLTAKGILNAEGNPYSSDSIRKIVDGRSNPAIVAEILILVNATRKNITKIANAQTKILKTA